MPNKGPITAFTGVPEQTGEHEIPWPDDCPPPGIYRDLSFDDYKALPLLNVSSLKWACISMRHVRACLDGEMQMQESPAMNFGAALHCFVLEPKRFEDDYPFGKTCCQRIKSGERAGKECGKNAKFRWQNDSGESFWYCGTHKSKAEKEVESVLTQTEYDHITAIGDRLANPDKYDLPQEVRDFTTTLRDTNASEVTAIARVDGIPFKSRLDRYIPPYPDFGTPPIIVDVKTMQVGAGAPLSFRLRSDGDTSTVEYALRKEIRKRGYDVQQAAYRRVIQELTGLPPSYFWLFVEKGPPYEILPLLPKPGLLEVGRQKLAKYLDAYKTCVIHNVWNGALNDFPGHPHSEIDADDWEKMDAGLDCSN